VLPGSSFRSIHLSSGASKVPDFNGVRPDGYPAMITATTRAVARGQIDKS
jgi:hypothetical protein